MIKPKALILLATGTNRDHDIADAFQLAGADTEVVPLNLLKMEKRDWKDYQILAFPGGFSYADALGAGKLLSIDINSYFSEQLTLFVNSGKPVIGVCNGFQALVKSGILPGQFKAQTTLTFNQVGHFECRWTTMQPTSQKCIWTRGLNNLIECPVAHGEGNFQVSDPEIINTLANNDQIALTYAFENGQKANGHYPENPNGSLNDIAGVCNEKGNVIGMMPHPENNIHTYQYRRWTRGATGYSGLPLFSNGVKYAQEL